MLLVNYKKTAVYPFPCPICILRRACPPEEGKPTVYVNSILCGDDASFNMASYRELAPAKMELNRMLEAYQKDPNQVFVFMKDPYSGGAE